MMNLIGFFGGLLLAVIGFLSFSIGGQFVFLVNGYVDESVWTEDLKYVNASADTSFTYGTPNTNIKPDYYAYLEFKEDSREDTKTILGNGGLVASFLGLVIVISTLMGPNGVISSVRSIGKKED